MDVASETLGDDHEVLECKEAPRTEVDILESDGVRNNTGGTITDRNHGRSKNQRDTQGLSSKKFKPLRSTLPRGRENCHSPH